MAEPEPPSLTRLKELSRALEELHEGALELGAKIEAMRAPEPPPQRRVMRAALRLRSE
jgi:hypothetical protein